MPQRTAIIGAVGSVLLAGGLAAAVTAARPGGPPDLGGVIGVTPPRAGVPSSPAGTPAPAGTTAPPPASRDAARAVTPPRPPAGDDDDDADDDG